MTDVSPFVSVQILLARHGNTFAPGDKVVWVGRETDLSLVASGREQARALGDALVSQAMFPVRIFAASLRRTREFAEIVAERVGNPPLFVDDRLNEIDYGAKGGLTTRELEASALGAKAALDAWNAEDRWPAELGWASTEAEIRANAAAFVRECLPAGLKGRTLVVSSNGILRFLAPLLLKADEVERHGSFKLKTGNFGVVERVGDDGSLRHWNIGPAQLGQPGTN